MALMVGISSYLPNDEEKRRIRFDTHKEQIRWLCSLLGNVIIRIVAQNYSVEEVNEINRISKEISSTCSITHYIYDRGIGLSVARDKLLGLFYDSDFDHILLIDDDIMIYPYYDCERILKEINDNPRKFDKIDAFRAQHPRYLPFKERVYFDKRNLTDWKFTIRQPGTSMQFSILRNIRKFKGKRIYNREGINSGQDNDIVDFNNYGLEDIDFHLGWIKNGFNWFDLEVMQMKEPKQKISTIFSEDVNERIKQEKVALQVTLKLNSDVGLRMKDGKINWKEVFGYFDKTPDILYIRREYILERFEDCLVPKKEKLKKKLF